MLARSKEPQPATSAPPPAAGLDYLSSPTGAIAEAQALAAASFGADSTFFLVNGCTAGIHAAVMATCPPGATLLLARNAHLSAFNAAVLAGCRVAWVEPEPDARHGVAHGVAPRGVEAALAAARGAGEVVGAVLVVSPTYFGVASRVAGGRATARWGAQAFARVCAPSHAARAHAAVPLKAPAPPA